MEWIMKSTMFGTLVAGLVLAGPAFAKDAKAAKPAKKDAKAPAEAGHCVANACKGSIAGAKNECKGKQACKGVTKEACEKDGKGTWAEQAAK
jgi:hypothetical protein